MSVRLARLAGQAMESARAGCFEEAASLWTEVLEIEPRHTQALSSLGVHALKQGDIDDALKKLEAARLTAPTDLFVLMTLADARRQAGDPEGEFEAIQWALAVDAGYTPALLQKGSWYERQGDAVSAYTMYAHALDTSSSETQWSGKSRSELVHARDFVERHTRKLREHIASEFAALLPELDDASAGRWCEATSIRAQRTKPYSSRSRQLHVPRLPAVPFFDRAEFPFLDALEANTRIIRDELIAVLEHEQDRFEPYIACRPGEPVHQWQALNHSTRWTACHLWRAGEPVSENTGYFPKTTDLLSQVALCDLSGLCPNVFFSKLAPKTHIPPHYGESNARVVGHLPLIVPRNCYLRVGFERREWREGQVLLFDDTLEHEAFNDSDAPRVVMVFDLWNPLLGNSDRRMANVLAEAARSFSG